MWQQSQLRRSTEDNFKKVECDGNRHLQKTHCLQNSHLKVSFNRNLLMLIFISSGLSRLYVTVLVQTVGKNILSLKEKIQFCQ